MNHPLSPQVDPALVQQASNAYYAQDYEKADKLLRHILSIDISHPKANHLHGLIAHLCGQDEAAEQLILRAIARSPDNAEFYNSLGIVLQKSGKFKSAEQSLSKAIELNPSYGEAYNNLAALFQDTGRFVAAEKAYLIADQLGDPGAYSNYLLLLNYHTEIAAETVHQKHLEWEKRYWHNNVGKAYSHKKLKPVKKLKVGYVSADFRAHSVAYFFEPLLTAHDSKKIETFCYYNYIRNDETNKRLRSKSDNWRDIATLNDTDAVKLIRKDGIDILVDLSGHCGDHRLGVFARKAAPIQVTWLGYPNTTGLSTMDYRLSDAVADPAGVGDELNCEKVVRLAHGFLCYQGPDLAAPNTPPSQSKNYITFGSFNNLAKVNENVIDVWIQILNRVPESRLLIKSPQLIFSENRNKLLEMFSHKGIDTSRIDLKAHVKSTEEHLSLYSHVDIALDTFPYNGTTTTCEALWMGVPVVTTLGDRHAARVGASILTHAQLENFIATDLDDYIDLAVELAADQQRLANLRSSLRDKLRNSVLTDQKLFAQSIEKVFKQITTCR